jgi:hypothetical protein
MRTPSPDHFRRRLVLSRRASIKARITALRNMKRPSLNFLLKLLNPRSKTPSELYLAATELYAYALERQKLTRKHAKQAQSTESR